MDALNDPFAILTDATLQLLIHTLSRYQSGSTSVERSSLGRQKSIVSDLLELQAINALLNQVRLAQLVTSATAATSPHSNLYALGYQLPLIPPVLVLAPAVSSVQPNRTALTQAMQSGLHSTEHIAAHTRHLKALAAAAIAAAESNPMRTEPSVPFCDNEVSTKPASVHPNAVHHLRSLLDAAIAAAVHDTAPPDSVQSRGLTWTAG